VVNIHGGTGAPSYRDPFGAGGLIELAETQFFSQRALVHLLLAGVFERFPRLNGFELAKLAPYAQHHDPTVAEIAEPLAEMPERPNQALRAR
jgi:hypothetical protein